MTRPLGAVPPLLRGAALCLAALASGCVLPVAPAFQDPPASQNYAPRILDADPALGQRVTSPNFRVTIQDPNVGDDLHVRYLADYPPGSEDTHTLLDLLVPHAADGRLLSQDVGVTASCARLAKLPSHQITVIVADRDFVTTPASPTQPLDPARVPPEGRSIVATWTLDLDCQ